MNRGNSDCHTDAISEVINHLELSKVKLGGFCFKNAGKATNYFKSLLRIKPKRVLGFSENSAQQMDSCPQTLFIQQMFTESLRVLFLTPSMAFYVTSGSFTHAISSKWTIPPLVPLSLNLADSNSSFGSQIKCYCLRKTFF